MSEPVYADSNVFIFPLIYGDTGKGKIASGILRKIEAGRLSAYTSVLTWDEVVWVIRRSLGKADSIQSGMKLIQFPNLRFIEVGESIIAKSQSLIEKYQLRPRDSIHCASALSRGIRMFLSDDSDFDTVVEMKRIPLAKIG